jgi:hypothetical protein
MDGWRRIGLDDDFPIRQALLVGVRFWCWARWARFSIENRNYITSYSIFTHNLSFFCLLEKAGCSG